MRAWRFACGALRAIHLPHREWLLRRLADMHARDASLAAPSEAQWDRARTELGWLERAASERGHVDIQEWVEDHVVRHKPLAYIIGNIPFGDLMVKTRPPVLIPRPETEEWALELVRRLKTVPGPLTALDIGTGTGCLALALSAGLKARSVATDIDPTALDVAHSNVLACDQKSSVQVVKADLFDAGFPTTVSKAAQSFGQSAFDLIVSNPPYIPKREYDTLDPSVRSWESSKALLGSDDDGLGFYRRIVEVLPSLLKAPARRHAVPRVALEVGKGQATRVHDLVLDAKVDGIEKVKTWKDFEGVDRVVVAYGL